MKDSARIIRGTQTARFGCPPVIDSGEGTGILTHFVPEFTDYDDQTEAETFTTFWMECLYESYRTEGSTLSISYYANARPVIWFDDDNNEDPNLSTPDERITSTKAQSTRTTPTSRKDENDEASTDAEPGETLTGEASETGGTKSTPASSTPTNTSTSRQDGLADENDNGNEPTALRSGSSRLPTGAIIGIAVGLIIFLMLLLLAAFLFMRRRREAPEPPKPSNDGVSLPKDTDHGHDIEKTEAGVTGANENRGNNMGREVEDGRRAPGTETYNITPHPAPRFENTVPDPLGDHKIDTPQLGVESSRTGLPDARRTETAAEPTIETEAMARGRRFPTLAGRRRGIGMD